jgi:REG-2-like HAD superfamily hydrolase
VVLASSSTLFKPAGTWAPVVPMVPRGAGSGRALAALSDFAKPTFHALFVDAAGTLLYPSEDTATVYSRYGKRYGLELSESEILARYRKAYAEPWVKSSIRYVDDGRPFWKFIVAESTGIDDEGMFEEIYSYYSRKEAWSVAPGAREALRKIREDMGLKTAIVSNFDSRLHHIMEDLDLTRLFDAIVVSADCSAEKPNPMLFLKACESLEVDPVNVVHVGDDRRNDVRGARDAGCYAWLWGDDVLSFEQVVQRIETGNLIDSLTEP